MHKLSCSVACGILPDQGSNPSLLRRQADSLPLSHQGRPPCLLIDLKTSEILACSGKTAAQAGKRKLLETASLWDLQSPRFRIMLTVT